MRLTLVERSTSRRFLLRDFLELMGFTVDIKGKPGSVKEYDILVIDIDSYLRYGATKIKGCVLVMGDERQLDLTVPTMHRDFKLTELLEQLRAMEKDNG